MQNFKAVSFSDITSGKSKVVSLSFTRQENALYKIVENLSSQEIRTLIGINSYDQLCQKAHDDRRNISQYIKVLLEKAIKANKSGFSTSDVTFRNCKDIPFQRWYPYIEGYSPNFVKSIIQQHIHGSCTIYDPFAGTGTTIFAADSLGFNTYYSEINPLLRHLISTKLSVLGTPSDDRIKLSRTINKLSKELLRFNNIENEKLNIDFIHVFKEQNYFPPSNYSKILKSKSYLDSLQDDLERDILTIAVLSSLIPSSFLKKQGDLRFKTEAEKTKGIPDFSTIFEENIKMICEDIESANSSIIRKNHICIIENAKNIRQADCDKIGCVITSPPYLNGTNYIRNTKLELWYLGYLKSDKDLRFFRDEILTSGINDVTLASIPDIYFESKLFNETYSSLKETAYDIRIPQMAKSYFSEMCIFLDDLKSKLEDGANIFIDIGDSIFNNVHIKTDLIIQDIASFLGYALIENKKLRERRSRNGQILSQILIHLKY